MAAVICTLPVQLFFLNYLVIPNDSDKTQLCLGGIHSAGQVEFLLL